MNVICIAGYSNAGKTHLIEQLIPVLKSRGLRVSVIKHAHHRFDIDHPGKDSFRHRAAGAFEVLIASRYRQALMREFERETPPDVHRLLAELDASVDWALVEGFKESNLPRLEVWRAAAAKPARYPEDRLVAAIATDSPARLPQPTALPVLDLNDAEAVAAWLLTNAHQFGYKP
jgi:molybdopterin-guanine dinucleotide biosynthesis protein B